VVIRYRYNIQLSNDIDFVEDVSVVLERGLVHMCPYPNLEDVVRKTSYIPELAVQRIGYACYFIIIVLFE
jgi:hypothetical protein